MASPKDVTNIPLGQSKWTRLSAQDPKIQVKNRYFETNPTNQVDQVSFLSRPGLRPWQVIGDGPARAGAYQAGSFNDDLFVVSDDSLYRVSNVTGVPTFISNDILPGAGKIAMAITGNIGSTPEYLFLADGRNLWCYMDDSYATGVYSGAPATGDLLDIAGTYYQFTAGSVDVGDPDGTVANPWLVDSSTTAPEAMAALAAAIMVDGNAGTQYSTNTTPNENVVVQSFTGGSLTVQASVVGALGNALVTTTTGTGATWGSGTLTGGGETAFFAVQTPDDVGISDVCYINEFVIAVAAQGQQINGRFFWIEPGETIIRPLNFATAEHSPDPIVQVLAVGDQFWLFGTSSLEVWYPTGDNTAPFQSIQGRLFEQGFWSGSAVKIKNVVIGVGRDGRVYSIGDSPAVISTPAIEEQIRGAIRIAESRNIL